jgi:hypothetical protein
MPILIDRVPIPEVTSEIVFREERVRVRGDQIIAWVTLTRALTGVRDPRLVPFPAILDTGHNDTFSIQERHLVEWAGLDPTSLPRAAAARDRGLRLTLRTAEIWVHRNQPGTRDRLAAAEPYGLSAPRGIAVYPSATNFPRLPLLGLRAITRNRLVLVVNGHRREATLRTAYRWWPLAGR